MARAPPPPADGGALRVGVGVMGSRVHACADRWRAGDDSSIIPLLRGAEGIEAMHAVGPTDGSSPTRRLARRLGAAGFVFFLVKGVLWLLVPAALWALRG